jgi:23S rRNA A1618 N6-methylase RlmF
VATECDDRSYSYARDNIFVNKVDDRVQLVRVDAAQPFLAAGALRDAPLLDFSMCNPPFYNSDEEMQSLSEFKDLPANAVSARP